RLAKPLQPRTIVGFALLYSGTRPYLTLGRPSDWTVRQIRDAQLGRGVPARRSQRAGRQSHDLGRFRRRVPRTRDGPANQDDHLDGGAMGSTEAGIHRRSLPTGFLVGQLRSG